MNRYPGFKLVHGREPIEGQDFDPNGHFCQEDYEFLTGTGRYTNNESEVVINECAFCGENPCTCPSMTSEEIEEYERQIRRFQ